jgi:hypothetical protein
MRHAITGLGVLVCSTGMMAGAAVSVLSEEGRLHCYDLRSHHDRVAQRGRPSTPEEASEDATRLLTALAAAPAGHECRAGLVLASLGALPVAGRTAEAIDMSCQAMTEIPDPAWRAMLANNAIGLRVQPYRGGAIPDGVRQDCRRDAIRGLEGQPDPNTLVDLGRLDDLASIMPLLHVVASTEPEPTQQAHAVAGLIDICMRAQVRARASGVRNPVHADLFELVKGRGDVVVRRGGSDVAAELWSLVTMIPLDAPGDMTSDTLFRGFAARKDWPLSLRREVVALASTPVVSEGAIVCARYGLLFADHASMERGEGSATSVLAAAESLLADLHALESSVAPGAVPVGLNGPRSLDVMIRQTLAFIWEIQLKRMGRCDLARPAAVEYIARYPDRPTARQMQRALDSCP